MRPLTTALRLSLAGSQYQAHLMAKTRHVPGMDGVRRIRSLHASPLPRRAPVPNATARPGATVGTSSSTSAPSNTLGQGGVNGSRSGTNGGAGGGAKRPSPHAMWYREIVPAMIPPLLLSLTLFLSLSLLRLHLSHQLSLSEQQAQIELLERELERLRRESVRRAERERRERERMLPVLVGKVLARVGVMEGDKDDIEEEEVEEAPRLLV